MPDLQLLVCAMLHTEAAFHFIKAHGVQVRATLEDVFTNSVRQGVGPINLNFTIPMYCASKLQVRYLQILKHDKNYSPYRWVRYVTMSNSYVIRTR